MRSNHRVRKMSLRRTISAALPLFLIVASFVTPLAAAQAGDSPTGATIASDKADYAPGELVTLTGTGWTGDATVNIEVNDTLGKSWQRIVDVPVVDGNITDSFNLPDRFVSDYDVTAKGVVNGIATTTFTDDRLHRLPTLVGRRRGLGQHDPPADELVLQRRRSRSSRLRHQGRTLAVDLLQLPDLLRLQVGHEEHLRLLGARYVQRRPTRLPDFDASPPTMDDCDTRWRRVGQLLHGERGRYGCQPEFPDGALAEAAVRGRDLHDGSWDRRQDGRPSLLGPQAVPSELRRFRMCRRARVAGRLAPDQRR